MEALAAIVEQKGGDFVLDRVEIEEPREGEVLVKIVSAGICHTDLSVRDQYYPTPLLLVPFGIGLLRPKGFLRLDKRRTNVRKPEFGRRHEAWDVHRRLAQARLRRRCARLIRIDWVVSGSSKSTN